MTLLPRDLWSGALACAAAGALMALSFVATPVKFLAAGVPLEHLLAVGRVTFRASLLTELILLFPLLLLARPKVRWLAGLAAFTLAVQWLVIMPPLDVRTLARMSGEPLPPSFLHLLWILADALRLLLYLAMAVLSLSPGRNSGGQELVQKEEVPT